MTDSRPQIRFPLAALLLLLLCAAAAGAQESAPADTTAAESGLQRAQRLAQEALEAGLVEVDSTEVEPREEREEGDEPYLRAWSRTPETSLKAAMQKVVWGGKLTSSLSFRDNSSFGQTGSWTYEDFRSQEKTVEKRDGTVSYSTDGERLLNGNLTFTDNWSRDEVTNSAGRTNVNLRDYKLAKATVNRDSLAFLGLLSDIQLGGTLSEQDSEQLGLTNDFSEAQLDGAIRTGWDAGDWFKVRTGVYGMTRSGDKTLGDDSSSSTAEGDTLRAGVYFDRAIWRGGFSVARSNFEKRYIDYRRNANGIIDTIGVEQKIVQEMERDDAVTLEWDNRLDLGPFDLGARLTRDVSENSFRASGVGLRERHQDNVDLNVAFRATRIDSVKISYTYLWKWDDQTFQGADEARGRQISKRRNLKVDWLHNLFTGTDLKFLFTTGLSQETAERGFNQNDRDRLESSFTAKSDSRWDNGFSVNLSFDARRVEDISIRSARSANNSVKDTYEVAPGYLWPVADWLDVDQSFRVWIQYTDYVFSDLETVDKQDDYNKRANLNTKFTIRPNKRIRLSIRHDYNFKSNAKKTRTDVTGNTFYLTEQEQRVSKVDFSLSWQVLTGLSLDATTYKTRDLSESFGSRARETERFSGQLAVGGQLDLKSRDKSRTLSAGVHKVFADGPSIQDYSREYWDADITFSWRF